MHINTNPHAKQKIKFLKSERDAMEKVEKILTTLARQDFGEDTLAKEVRDTYQAFMSFIFQEE